MKQHYYFKILVCYIMLAAFNLQFFNVTAQERFTLGKKVSRKIDFKFVGNLMIIPIDVNGVTLSFVLDSGINKPILFNLTENDSLEVRNTKTIFLQGLGADGKVEALKSSNNTFKIGNATKTNEDLYVLLDNSISFTPRLGVVVHGIIGYTLFKDFIVEVNYNSSYIRLHTKASFEQKKLKKWQELPLQIFNNKPYINTQVALNGTTQNVKLLIDTGSSDAIWLFEDKKKQIYPHPEKNFHDFLGKGLSGSVYGHRSKIDKLLFNNFELKEVNVAYPDSSALDKTKVVKGRNGSVGAEVLKRFNIYFDYSNKKIYLKKNSYFKEDFTYNNSGITLNYNGNRYVKEAISISENRGSSYERKNEFGAVKINMVANYAMSIKPIYAISEIRQSSNAYKSGLRIGDILITVNGKLVSQQRLPEVNTFFHGKTGKTLRLKIERNGIKRTFKFKLDSAFKQKSPLIN